MPRPFPLRSTALHIMKPVLPNGGQLILFWSWARNKATEDSDRHPHGHRQERRFFSTSFHNTLIHNDLLKTTLLPRRFRLYCFFTVFTAKACPAGMPEAPHCFVRAISKKSAEQFAEQLAEGSLHKANKFVLLSASAYICPTFRIFNLKY